jgi:hypothetical protein
MTSFPHSLPKQSILGNRNQFRLFPHAAKIVFYNWKCKISKCFGLAELLFCSMRNPIRPINGRPIATCIDGFLYQCQDFLALPVYAPGTNFSHDGMSKPDRLFGEQVCAGAQLK